MKKVYLLLTSLLFLLVLVACGDKGTDPKVPPVTPPTDGEDGDDDDTKYDLGGIEFVIMVDNALRADPRSSQYERLFQQEKVALMDKVEKKYNVKVVYKNYPTNASWGGARERYIIEETAFQSKSAHVYEIISTSLPNLVEQKAIVPLDDYMQAYGSPRFWASKKEFGLVKGKYYGYDDQFSIADKGLYYNVDLMAQILGPSRKNEPLELWQKGEWTWENFEKLVNELNGPLDHTRTDENGGPQYVLGGRTYNYAYGFIGANGGKLVDADFNTYLTDKPVLDSLEFLSKLRMTEGMWIDDASLSNTSQPQFTAGNVVFQDGESWHITASNKWGSKNFAVNYVPWPVGPNVKSDMSNYKNLTVGGKSTYVISSAFSKANIPAGYEDLMIHDETIFKIWADLQYFPETLTEVEDNFYSTRLFSSYESEISREIHLSLIDSTIPDYFYSVIESQAQTDQSFMIKIQAAIQSGEVRNTMTATESALQALFIERYNLGENYYNR